MRTLTLIVLTLAATGCAGDYTRADLLEPATIAAEGDEGGGADLFHDFDGAISVEVVDAEAGDYTVEIAEVGRLAFHSPGRLDLSVLHGRALQGRVAAEMSLTAATFQDEEGLVYAAFTQDSPDVLAEFFGEGVFAFGDRIGRDEHDGSRFVLTALDVQTDEGKVEILPGEAAGVTLDGQRWQVVLHGAYKADPALFDRAKCGPGDRISLEVLRLDEPREEILTRPEDREPLGFQSTCG